MLVGCLVKKKVQHYRLACILPRTWLPNPDEIKGRMAIPMAAGWFSPRSGF